eukprot:5468622-Pleurochrysis_carterae.AAC.1
MQKAGHSGHNREKKTRTAGVIFELSSTVTPLSGILVPVWGLRAGASNLHESQKYRDMLEKQGE